MKNSSARRSTSKSNQATDYTWRMYEILIAELKHQHNVWLDNFRVILTFNSILLPGSFAVFALVLQGKVDVSGLALQFLPLPVVILSIIGIFTTLAMMVIISRINSVNALRQREVRKLEIQMISDLPIHPFLEGFMLSGGSVEEKGSLLEKIKPMKWYWFRGKLGYNLISTGFIVAYVFLGAASIIMW